MADTRKSRDALLVQVASQVHRQIFAELNPLIQALIESALKLERILSAGPARVRRDPRGGSLKGVAGSRSGTRRRTPRGVLQREIRKALERGPGPIRLARIRDRIMNTLHFKYRDPKPLYTQIAHAVKKMPEVGRMSQWLSIRLPESVPIVVAQGQVEGE